MIPKNLTPDARKFLSDCSKMDTETRSKMLRFCELVVERQDDELFMQRLKELTDRQARVGEILAELDPKLH